MFAINGILAEHLPLASRALNYGDGIFTSAKVKHHKIELWPYHRERLLKGAQVLGLDVDLYQLEQQLAAFCQQRSTAFALKIIVARAGSERGFAPASQQSMSIFAASELPVSNQNAPLRLGVYHTALEVSSHLRGLKTLNALAYVLAASECAKLAEYDDLILQDSAGMVVEALYSNVFWRYQGEWFTSSLNRAGVAGVVRASVIDFFARHRQFGQLNIVDMPVADLQLAESIMLCNSLRGFCLASHYHCRKLDQNLPWRAAYNLEYAVDF